MAAQSFRSTCSPHIIRPKLHYFLAIHLCVLLFTLPKAHGEDSISCLIEGFDLSPLENFSPWVTVNNATNATFNIHLCNKLKTDQSSDETNCPDGTSICAHYPNKTVINFGSHLVRNSSAGTENGQLIVAYKGQACPEHDGELFTSFFYFKCGKTLGHPFHIGDIGACYTHFQWESYVFCKDLPVPENEVPCTVMKNGHLIDLSPLIKLTGAYLVDDANNKKVYINVCRDIKPGKHTDASDPLSHCPNGAGSCHVINNSEGKDYGHPTQRLEAADDGVKLVYTSSSKPEGCEENPTTTILFRCPKRGGSRDPVLVTDFVKACSVNIEWVTEYSCPIDYLSSKTCKLTSAQHDVDIDLSPLKNPVAFDHPYVVNVTDGKDHYMYYINVCDRLAMSCKGHGTSVCQLKANDVSYAESLGKSHQMKLRYSDQELTLIYSEGDKCHTGFGRKTFIRFVCNKTADNDGKGYPTFVTNDNCSYSFEWHTKYACVNHLVDDTCSVDYKGKRYDLSPLVKTQGSWQVLTGDDSDGDTSYYANICHDVLHDGPTAGCPAGSAMCAKGPDGFTSLGMFTKHLQYEEKSNSLKLVYTDGDKNGENCVRSTVINFYCLPGVVDSAPIMVHKSVDGCYHEVEWHTAAACVLSHKKGNNCKVTDDAGYTFDLTPLKSDAKAYIVDQPDYTYYINVCDEIKDDNNPCTTPPHAGAAICQQEKQNDKNAKKIGEPATLLEYYDGILNLTYTNGDPYNNKDHTPRTAEIAFECDMAADQGKPEFLEEKNFTYAFRWKTSYACPVTPIECVVTDTSKNVQYDLSRLSKTTENWVWIDDDASKKTKQKFYMNVCRPLVKSSNMHCSPFASVCVTNVTNVDGNIKETISHGNLGRLAGPPLPEKTLRGAKIVYINGNDCDDNGVKKKFMTTLHILCSKGKLTGAPAKPVLIRPCEYSILWETEAGCPINVESTSSPEGKGNSGTCSIKDPNSDFVFNLMPLAKSGDDSYEVKSTDGKTVYKLNICHGLSESVCGKFESQESSICKDSTPVAMLAKDLSLASTGEISLEYKGKRNPGSGIQDKYTLNFFCKRTAQTPVITFEKQEGLETVFRVESALACPPEPVECLVQDNYGRQYDLSPLALKDKNWIVVDNRPAHSNLKYHINVCRPVNPTSDMTCPGGAVGACQTGDKSFNMGYVQSKPIASSNGSAITIVYQGGDICHNGTTNQAYRSTRIIFSCANVDHDPVFLVESDTCEYSFIWKTPSACPQHSTTGADCKVKESLYNMEFDLNALRKKTDNYIVKGDGYDFVLNICGPVVTSSSTCPGQNVGACQTGGGLNDRKVELGKSNSNVIYDSGALRLVYTEGKANCHGKYDRKTIIRFECDESTSGDEGPKYVEETSECVYQFLWKTRLACPPYQVKDCTFRHGNNIYDLTALEKIHDNYEIDKEDKKYILNVCRSLASKKGQTCPLNAAACSIDLTATDEKKKYHSLGSVNTTSFSMEQNKLLLRYSNGDLCPDGKTRMKTQINFECDKDSDALGIPHSHFIVNGCDHHFLWTTRAACPLVKTEDNVDQKDFGDCKVKNPQTGYEFDLSSLKKSSGYKTYDRQGHLFTLNICGWLDSASGCPNGTGSCQSGMAAGISAENAGKANANLIFRDGVIALEYAGGKACPGNGQPSTTIISFVCMPGAGNGVPVYVDKSHCLYYFDWHTDLVCEKQVTCSVKTANGHTLDFSPLVQHSGKYNVLPNAVGTNTSPGVIYLNLCRPLNPVFGTLCPPGSAACLVRNGQKPLGLGHVHDDMVYNANAKEARLTYSHGDVCPTNPMLNTSSLIILKCGHTDFSQDPVLDTVTSDCVYIFVWVTPYACEKNPTIPYSSCSFYDDKDAVIHDLSALTDEVEASSAHEGTFTIKACDHFDKGERGDASCSQAAVCLRKSKDRDGSYGSFKDASVKVTADSKAVTFTGGRKCHSGGVDSTASATIHFKCGSTSGNGIPIIIDDGDCDAVFEWHTNLVCPPVRKDCLITDHGSLYDLSLLSQDTGSWNYTDSDGNIYWINLCQGLHGKALQSMCSHNSAVCMKGADGTTHVLGKVTTQTTQVIGENKEKTILVKYTDGDTSLCTRSRRRRSDKEPTVIISLKCADTIGAPILEKHDKEKCTYEFTWKTRVACATEPSSSPIKEEKGFIKDKRSGQTIDLNSLLKPKVNSEVNVGDQRYLVNLIGQLNLNKEQQGASVCRYAAMCHYSGKTKKYRNIGDFTQRKYYMFDEQLEVKFTSPEKCKGEKSSSHVSSTVIFDCVHNKTEHGLSFLYHTSDCSYVFMWKTDIVCIRPVVNGDTDSNRREINADNKPASAGAGGSSTKILVGVLIFAFIAIVCIMVLVLHKPEKRAAFKSGLKRCILCRRRREQNMTYSILSQSAEDDDLDLKDDDYDPFNPFNEPDEEAEINNGHLPANLNPFHDDSDEDLLI